MKRSNNDGGGIILFILGLGFISWIFSEIKNFFTANWRIIVSIVKTIALVLIIFICLCILLAFMKDIKIGIKLLMCKIKHKDTSWYKEEKERLELEALEKKEQREMETIQKEERRKFSEKRKIHIQEELARIDCMDGHDFEYWCAKLLKNSGFSNVNVTPRSNDQGVDITAFSVGKKYAFQCKRYSSDIGNSPVQEVYTGQAVYGCQVGVVITNAYFTDGAVTAAKATGILLWDRNKIIELLMKNYK